MKAGPAYRFFTYLLELCLGRSSNYPHNVQKLVLVISSSKKRRSRDHFSKDATTGPHIDRCAVSPRAKKYIGGAVPQGNDLD